MGKTRFHTFFTEVRQIACPSRYCLITLALLSASFLCALAQDSHSHRETTLQQQQVTAQQKSNTNTLIKIARDSANEEENSK